MPTSQEMHKIVATRPMVQAKLFLQLDAISHQNLVCTRRTFLGCRKFDPCYKWAGEPAVEDDFASTGDLGVSGLVRLTIKALEAQGRGFAHGHEKHHSEPRVKAIDIIQLFLGCNDLGAAEHTHNKEQMLNAWIDAHASAMPPRSSLTPQWSRQGSSGVRNCERCLRLMRKSAAS